MGVHDRPVSFFVLCGGILGMFAGFGLCYWVSTIAHPLNVGGRPMNSWPSFIPVTFELTILIASFAAVISMIALNGLPMPYIRCSTCRHSRARARTSSSWRSRHRPEVRPHAHVRIPEESRSARKSSGEPAPRKPPRSLLAITASLFLASGCRQDMHDQPMHRPLRASAFFENTSSARPLVDGTIARGTLQTDAASLRGKRRPVCQRTPFPVTQAVLDRGQERFNIYCSCHDATGSGNGLVVQRGYPKPQSYHTDRLRKIEAGHFFDVMTNGFGRMPDYRAQLTPRDRWNVVAYIRALQLSQHAPTRCAGRRPDEAGQAGGDRARTSEALNAFMSTQAVITDSPALARFQQRRSSSPSSRSW